jgi:hypothetical protein
VKKVHVSYIGKFCDFAFRWFFPFVPEMVLPFLLNVRLKDAMLSLMIFYYVKLY